MGDAWTHEDNVKHPKFDTQGHYGQVALSMHVYSYLDEEFNFHDSTEDARATMLLYLRINPFKCRHSFKDELFKFDKTGTDFPALGSGPVKTRNN